MNREAQLIVTAVEGDRFSFHPYNGTMTLEMVIFQALYAVDLHPGDADFLNDVGRAEMARVCLRDQAGGGQADGFAEAGRAGLPRPRR